MLIQFVGGATREVGKNDTEHLEGAVGYDGNKNGDKDESSKSPEVNFSQTVSIVSATNVQIGNNNKYISEGGYVQNIGGNNSINTFGGVTAVDNVYMHTTMDGASGGLQRHSVERDFQGQNNSQVIENVKAENVNIITNLHTESPKHTKEFQMKSESFQKFRKSVGNFRDGHYILITDRTEDVKRISALGRASWTAVFDFDVSSRRDGLLSHVEEIVASRRCLKLLPWNEKCTAITEHGTSWFLMNGNYHIQSSDISTNTLKDWKRKTKVNLEANIAQMSKFKEGNTEFTVIVLWPNNSQCVHQIRHLVEELEQALDPRTLIICENKIDDKNWQLALDICMGSCDNVEQIPLSLGEVCTIIADIYPPDSKSATEYEIPNAYGTSILDITDKEVNFIADDLEVLYSTDHTGLKLEPDQYTQVKNNFYKGGTLPWAWWYQIGPNDADIERDLFPKVKKYIQENIDQYKSGTITICHKPGSGGTTLAQRILWYFKEKVPCAQVKPNTWSSPEIVNEQIQLLCRKTNLPLLLLVDGEEQGRVQVIEKMNRDRCCLIILYVKRCSSEVMDERSTGKATFWLPGHVSEREAKILRVKYEKLIDETKEQEIEKMFLDIKRKHERSLFEFGLLLHSHNYKGLTSYVSGYLQLALSRSDDFKPYHKALVFLALVYYYSQSTLSCHFLSGILGIPEGQNILRFEDLPEEMHGLVVKDELSSPNGIRVSHVLVAKEILDQLLCRSLEKRQSLAPSQTINKYTKMKLVTWAKCFIEYAGKKDKGRSSGIKSIVTKTFISRDNTQLGEDEAQTRRKPKLSQILDDVSFKAPYTERFDLLIQLTKSFPNEPQYFAHLGRLYTICRPEEHAEAEKHFQKALELCPRDIDEKIYDDIPHKQRMTMMHIYHMYGTMFLNWVSPFTGRYLGDKPKFCSSGEPFEITANRLLEYTNKACKYFNWCREITPAGHEKYCHYQSEISIRLMLSDYIRNNCGRKTLHQYMDDQEADENLRQFLLDSSEKLDELFIDCMSVVEPEQMGMDIKNCNLWYSRIYKDKESTSRARFAKLHKSMGDNMHTRRMRIAFVKMNYSDDGKAASILESVQQADDIEFIVKEYENNFADENQILTRHQTDIDYREWLFAIRHHSYTTNRALTEILTFVQEWYDMHRTPYSRFYLFILKSLIGFGDGKYLQGNDEVLLAAQTLKSEMTEYSKFITKPKYPREWLGQPCSSIRRLVPGRRFFGWMEYQDEIKNSEIVTGTISGQNKKQSGGYIHLDLGQRRPVDVKVFFIPGLCELKGSVYMHERVEFNLGFSMSHGYEAFNVKLLKTMDCEGCRQKLKYRSCDKIIYCPKCKTNVTINRNGTSKDKKINRTF